MSSVIILQLYTSCGFCHVMHFDTLTVLHTLWCVRCVHSSLACLSVSSKTFLSATYQTKLFSFLTSTRTKYSVCNSSFLEEHTRKIRRNHSFEEKVKITAIRISITLSSVSFRVLVSISLSLSLMCVTFDEYTLILSCVCVLECLVQKTTSCPELFVEFAKQRKSQCS